MAPGMRGAIRARHSALEHFREHLNPRIVAARAASAEVDPVVDFRASPVPHDRVDFPLLEMEALNGVIVEQLDYVNGDPCYRWNWTLRAWFWVRGEGYDATADRVQLLAALGAETLLALPAMGPDDDRVQLVPQPMRISLSLIEDDPDMRASMAGAYLEFVVTMAETATTDPLGTAETLTVNPLPKPTE